jgi:ferredoxin-NADP reductase
MRFRVRGHIRDLLAFRGLVPARRKRFARAPLEIRRSDPMNDLARRLHPHVQHLLVAEVREETTTTRTLRVVADHDSTTRELAYFRAGQYLSLKVEVDGTSITRPYSISSAPVECLGENGFYDLTVRRRPGGFLTGSMWQHWRPGTKVRSSGPCGTFYHEPLRDSRKIVGLAGGAGITPFRAMAREIVYGEMDAELLLIYGSNDEDDIVFRAELAELEAKAPDRIRVVHVLSCEQVSLAGCERGFITADLIRKHADLAEASFFVCGPPAMYRFVEKELDRLGLPRKRVRREVFGEQEDVTRWAGFPQEVADKTFRMVAHVGEATVEAPVRAVETVLTALERANLAPPSECRSGECGFCRALLVKGEVFIRPEGDGRRAADKRLGYIHPCAAYPLSNLEVAIARGA